MEIIVTSGGTISRIDDVRHIGNFSEGSTGARIAEELLRRGATVHYVHNVKSRRPFRDQLTLDPTRPLEEELARAGEAHRAFQAIAPRLHEHPYETFEEYHDLLRDLLTPRTADIILLAAAVSDYGAQAQPGKLSSDQESLTIHLVRLPKVISLVKQWHPAVFQVGFKLLASTPIDQLVETGSRHGHRLASDLTVANTLLGGDFRRRITVLITPEGALYPVSLPDLPVRLADLLSHRFSRRIFRTEILPTSTPTPPLTSSLQRLTRRCLLPSADEDTGHFGYLALRDGNGFLFATPQGTVRVTDIDYTHRILHADGPTPPAAEIAGRLLLDRPEVGAILLAPVLPGLPRRTPVAHTPGTQKQLDEVLHSLGDEQILELTSQGLLVLGTDIDDLLARIEDEPACTPFPDLDEQQHLQQILTGANPRAALSLDLTSAHATDLRTMTFSSSFDSIVAPWALRLLHDPDSLTACLQHVCTALHPGGVSLFRVPHLPDGLHHADRLQVIPTEKTILHRREAITVEGRTWIHSGTHTLFHRDGSAILRGYHCLRLGFFTPEEIELSAQLAGFTSLAFCDTPELSSIQSWTRYAIATK